MTHHRSLSQTLRKVAGAAGLLLASLVIAASATPAAFAAAPSAVVQLAQGAPTPAPTNAPKPTAPATTPKKTQLYDPLNNASITTLVARATLGFMGLSGTAALLFFVYGGFLMITASGNEKKYSEGLNSLKWAVIGLLIIFGSYALLNTLFNALGAASS